jgi:hypothetical protein
MTIYYCCYGAYADIGHSEGCPKKGGFFDLPKTDVCRDPSHNPPSHLYVPPGKGYNHICPSCGKASTITSPHAEF